MASRIDMALKRIPCTCLPRGPEQFCSDRSRAGRCPIAVPWCRCRSRDRPCLCRAMHRFWVWSGSQCRDARGHMRKSPQQKESWQEISTSPPVNPPSHQACSWRRQRERGFVFPNFPTSHQSPVVGCWSLPERCSSRATTRAAEGGVFIFIQSIPPVARGHEQRRAVMTESHVDGAAGCR
jgi:hypothetical protein